MHCVKILEVVLASRAFFFIDYRQAGPSQKAKYEMQRLCVSVSYFLNEWTVSSVLYTFIALLAYFWRVLQHKKRWLLGICPRPRWGNYQAPPYPLAGGKGAPLPHPPRGGSAYTPTIIYIRITFCNGAVATALVRKIIYK